MAIAPVASDISNFVRDVINEATLQEVLAPFDTYLKFNVGNAVEADLLFAGELHNIPHCKKIVGELIKCFAAQGPVIILDEAFTAGRILDRESTEKYLESNDCPTQNLKNIYIVGCDIDEKSKESLGLPQHCVEQLQHHLNRHVHMKEQAMIVLKNLTPGQNDIRARILPELDKVNKSISLLEEKIDVHRRNPVSAKELAERAEPLFPSRVAATVSVLRTLPAIKKQLRLPPQTRVLGTVGLAHIKTLKIHLGNPNYHLTPFYEELENHSAALLVPKACQHL